MDTILKFLSNLKAVCMLTYYSLVLSITEYNCIVSSEDLKIWMCTLHIVPLGIYNSYGHVVRDFESEAKTR